MTTQPIDPEKIEGSQIENLQTPFQKQKERGSHFRKKILLNLGNENEYAWQHENRSFIFLIFQVTVMILRGSIKFSKQLNAAFLQTFPYPETYIPYLKCSGPLHLVVFETQNNKEQ